MKGSRQKLAVEQHRQHPSKIISAHTPRPYDPRSICQRQVEQLGAQLPIVAAGIVYQDPNHEQRQSIVSYTQKLASSCYYPDLSDLKSEAWFVDSLPVLKLSEVGIVENLKVFICLLDNYCSQPEYLMILTDDALSELQQQWTEQQAEFLINHLTLCRECCRQQAKIQLLEQVLRKAEHQLRNPLALISLYAANLCHGLSSGILKKQAKVISETANELSSTLTDLLSCSQQAKLHIETHDLRTILADSIQGLQPWLDQKQLQINYPESPFMLAVDRGQIRQVFDNLLSNAVHFSPAGGTIICQWQIFLHEVLFEISDQGLGLSEEDLKQAFTAFYTRREGGTGLGLAIAKKIILDHQGNLWVQNLPQGGAQFSFTLPRSNPLMRAEQRLQDVSAIG